MANRYLVVGGTWDAVNTAIWSATDGGAGGASVPGAGDAVLMSALSGAVTVTLAYNPTITGLNLNGFTGTFDGAGFEVSCNINNTNVVTQTVTSTVTNVTVNLTYAGGTGTRILNINAAVTEANAINFKVSAGTDIVNVVGVARNVDLTGFAGTFSNQSRTIYGNWTIPNTVTVSAGILTTTLGATSGVQLVTTNGVALDFPITVNVPNAVVRLAGNLTAGSTRNFTQTAGGIDLQTFVLSVGLWANSNSAPRSVNWGVGSRIDLTGNNTTILTMATATNFTYTGTPVVRCTYSGGVGTRSMSFGGGGGATEANALNLYVTAGSDIINVDGTYRTVDCSGFTGTFAQRTRTLYGDLTGMGGCTIQAGTSVTTFAATTGVQQFTTSGKLIDFPVTVTAPGATVRFMDAYTGGTGRLFTHNSGDLDFQTFTFAPGLFASSNTNTRGWIFGVGAEINVTGNANTIWNCSTLTGLTITGTPRVRCSYSGSVGTRNFNHGNSAGATFARRVDLYITAGTDSFDPAGTAFGVVDFTGFAGTLPNRARTSYGDLKFVPGITSTSGAGIWTLAQVGGTQKLTTGGNTLNFPITFDGVGTAFQLQDNCVLESVRTGLLANGTIQLNGFRFHPGLFSSSNTNVRGVDASVAGSEIRLSGSNSTIWSVNDATNFTITGTLLVTLTYSGGVGQRTVNHGTAGSIVYANIPSFACIAGSDTVSMNVIGHARDITMSNFTGIFSPPGNIWGSLVQSPGSTTLASASNVVFRAPSGMVQTITSNGVVFDRPLTVLCPGATLRLLDALTVGVLRTVNHNSGDIDLQDLVWSMGFYAASNANVRGISVLPGGGVTLTGSGTTIWNVANANNFTLTGDLVVTSTYAGGTSTRSFAHGTTAGATEANTPSFHITAGSDTINFSPALAYAHDLLFSGFTGIAGLPAFMYGDLELSAGSTTVLSSSGLRFIGSGVQTIKGNGVVMQRSPVVEGPGSLVLVGDVITDPAYSIVLNAGGLDLNGYRAETGFFTSSSGSPRDFDFNGGVLEVADTFTVGDATGLVVTYDGDSRIEMAGDSFTGGGLSWPEVIVSGDALTVHGDNTFSTISNDVTPTTVLFDAGTVQTFLDGFDLSGDEDGLVTISTNGSGQHTLVKDDGRVVVHDCDISHSIATGGAFWNAPFAHGCIDSGDNSGWVFMTSIPNNQGNRDAAIPVRIVLTPPVPAAEYPNRQSLAAGALPVNLVPAPE